MATASYSLQSFEGSGIKSATRPSNFDRSPSYLLQTPLRYKWPSLIPSATTSQSSHPIVRILIEFWQQASTKSPFRYSLVEWNSSTMSFESRSRTPSASTGAPSDTFARPDRLSKDTERRETRSFTEFCPLYSTARFFFFDTMRLLQHDTDEATNIVSLTWLSGSHCRYRPSPICS